MPIVPSIEVNGRSMPVLHVSQIASILQIPTAELLTNSRLAFDTVNILTSWLEILRQLNWDMLNKPTRSRGRTIRNLTVNTFHPFELLPRAWHNGQFDWYPEHDADREALLTDAAAVVSYAQERLFRWQGFVLELDEEPAGAERNVQSPRGDVKFSTVLTSQRWHCAYHHRQLVHFLKEEGGGPTSGLLDVEVMHDIDLPESVY